MTTLASIISFLIGLLRDPVSKDLSSARLCALGLCVVGCIVALAGMHTEHPEGIAAIVAALVGGGGVALFTRTQGKD